jgi:hypothetical protein
LLAAIYSNEMSKTKELVSWRDKELLAAFRWVQNEQAPDHERYQLDYDRREADRSAGRQAR